MKIIYKVLFIILLFTNCNIFSQKNNLPTFTAQLEDWHKNEKYLSDSSAYLHVKTSIINNSSDTLCYLTMSCSWEEFYIINSRELLFPIKSCDENGLILMKIPPHKMAERLLELSPFPLGYSHMTTEGKLVKATWDDKNQIHNIKFKIGFKLYAIPYNIVRSMINWSDLWKYKNPKNEIVLWTNTLEL